MEEKILKELADRLYENVRMASFAIDCLIEKIENPKLAELLRKQKIIGLELQKHKGKNLKEFV